MTPDQIKSVQSSFRGLAPFRDYAAEVFYDRLFEIDPSAEPLFSGVDLRAQGVKLMAALAVIVGKLRQPEALLDAAGAAAVRHFSFGLQERHYTSAGRALIAMLECILGHEWTHELWVAWAEVYTMVSQAMVKTMRTQEAA